MAKYRVIWRDCQYDRTGDEFSVVADDPGKAYLEAMREIKGFSDYLKEHFVSTDIEALVDEEGTLLDPDDFLREGH